VRALGERRRTRSRVALAAVAVLVAAGLGGGVAAVTAAGSGSDALRQAAPGGAAADDCASLPPGYDYGKACGPGPEEPVDCAELGIDVPPGDGEFTFFDAGPEPYSSDFTCTFDPEPTPRPARRSRLAPRRR
jgi:hypothetical protein